MNNDEVEKYRESMAREIVQLALELRSNGVPPTDSAIAMALVEHCSVDAIDVLRFLFNGQCPGTCKPGQKCLEATLSSVKNARLYLEQRLLDTANKKSLH